MNTVIQNPAENSASRAEKSRWRLVYGLVIAIAVVYFVLLTVLGKVYSS